jgi:orotidine-5'-phosphate decarboxylase
MPERKNRIFVALDTPELGAASDLARMLAPAVGGIKLGLEFFVAQGPDGIRRVKESHAALPLFLDLKLHDIPNTVAGGVRSAARLDPTFVTVHASGGDAMMRAAADAAKGTATKLLGITVLTSLDDQDLAAVGQALPGADQVRRLAALAQASRLDGVVCAPPEVALLRRDCGPDFTLVVPGVRPEWAGADDQKRVMTPAEAVESGADYLVIGRPITRAHNPAEAARRIAAELPK